MKPRQADWRVMNLDPAAPPERSGSTSARPREPMQGARTRDPHSLSPIMRN